MNEVMPLLEESDFLVLPLVGEGTVGKTIPAKFQAYLAAARPIFGVLAGTVAEMIEKEGLGILGDPRSISAVREGFLSAAASSRDRRSEISRRVGGLPGGELHPPGGDGQVPRVRVVACSSIGP